MGLTAVTPKGNHRVALIVITMVTAVNVQVVTTRRTTSAISVRLGKRVKPVRPNPHFRPEVLLVLQVTEENSFSKVMELVQSWKMVAQFLLIQIVLRVRFHLGGQIQILPPIA